MPRKNAHLYSLSKAIYAEVLKYCDSQNQMLYSRLIQPQKGSLTFKQISLKCLALVEYFK